MGHIYSLWLDRKEGEDPRFPFVVLVVSGGHTELYLAKSHKEYVWLGGTRDDAVGECFDKVARVLGLGYPGGPALDAEASKISNSKFLISNKNQFKLPRPMTNSGDCDFSFSGLKTTVYKIVTTTKLTSTQVNLPAASCGASSSQGINSLYCRLSSSRQAAKHSDDFRVTQLAYEFREAAIEILIAKLVFAAKKYNVSTIAVVGGVSANALLRQKLEELKSDYSVFYPPLKYTGDNAAMIASCAYFKNALI